MPFLYCYQDGTFCSSPLPEKREQGIDVIALDLRLFDPAVVMRAGGPWKEVSHG